MIYFVNFNTNINAYFQSFVYCMQYSNCSLNVKNIDSLNGLDLVYKQPFSILSLFSTLPPSPVNLILPNVSTPTPPPSYQEHPRLFGTQEYIDKIKSLSQLISRAFRQVIYRSSRPEVFLGKGVLKICNIQWYCSFIEIAL